MHVLKTHLPPLNKRDTFCWMRSLDITLPISQFAHVLLLCSWPTPTPSTGRCSNSFIVNLMLYRWFITKGFSLSCPPRWGVHVDCISKSCLTSIPPTPGGTTADVLTVSDNSGWWGGGPRAVLMLTVDSFNPVLKMHKNMKQTPLNSRDFKMGILQIHNNRNHF